jgi:hypothetical protein
MPHPRSFSHDHVGLTPIGFAVATALLVACGGDFTTAPFQDGSGGTTSNGSVSTLDAGSSDASTVGTGGASGSAVSGSSATASSSGATGSASTATTSAATTTASGSGSSSSGGGFNAKCLDCGQTKCESFKECVANDACLQGSICTLTMCTDPATFVACALNTCFQGNQQAATTATQALSCLNMYCKESCL